MPYTSDNGDLRNRFVSRFGSQSIPANQLAGGGGGMGIPGWLKAVIKAPSFEPLYAKLFGLQAPDGGHPDPNFPGFGTPNLLQSLMGQATGFSGLMGEGTDSAPPHQAGQLFRPAPEQELNPIQVALAQLQDLMDQGASMGPTQEDLQNSLDSAAAGIRQQYGAGIGLIKDQSAGAKSDTASGSAEVQKMYKALQGSYNRSGKREQRQGNKLAQQIQGLANQSQQASTNQARQLNNQSQAAAEGLGLPELAQQQMHQANHQAQTLGNQANQRGQMAANTVLGQAGNNRTYMNTQGQTSRLEGTNRAADMYAQLQDYLDQNRAQIGDLAAQRTQALAASEASINSQYGQASQDTYQNSIDNKLALLKLAMDANQQQFDQSQALSKSTDLTEALKQFYGMLPDQVSGPSQLLAQSGDPTINKLYGQLSTAPEMGTGFFNAGGNSNDQQSLLGNYSNMQKFAAQMVGPAWGSLSEGERQTLVSALLLQMQGMTPTKSQP